jgi:hypothetical protein
MSPLPSHPAQHSQQPALPNPALRNGARAVEKSEKLFEPNRRPKAKTASPTIPKTKNEEPRHRGEFFSLDRAGAILAGVGTAGAFSLVTFFLRKKKVTTLKQGPYLTSKQREKSKFPRPTSR